MLPASGCANLSFPWLEGGTGEGGSGGVVRHLLRNAQGTTALLLRALRRVTVTINWDGMHVPCESIANIAYTVVRPLGRSEKSIIDVLVVKSGVVRVNQSTHWPAFSSVLSVITA